MSLTLKAAVLLSTFNGGKYLRCQIDSILGQDYPLLDLYIRDDGSADDTINIISGYADRYHNVHLISEPSGNLGYPACFYALTDLDIDADVFFFSDQDDYWYPDKVSQAIRWFSTNDADRPAAYYARYQVCDDSMNPIMESPSFSGCDISLRNALFQVYGLEFTMAINRAAKDYLFAHKPKTSNARGTWMFMLFASKGTVYFDDFICANYRRHSSAVTNSDSGFWGIWIWRIKNFLINGDSKSYREILRDFERVMLTELTGDEQKLLSTFIRGSRASKVFYPKRLRTGIAEEFGLRIMFALGKL